MPVDLNSLLWAMERRIADRCQAAGDRACASRFASLATRRKAAIDRYLWQANQARYTDWDLSTGEQWGHLITSGILWLAVPMAIGLWRVLRAEPK